MFFNNQEFGGTHFWKERALAHHTTLKKMDKAVNPKQFLDRYIVDFCKSHATELKHLGAKTVTSCQQVENDYFSLVDQIFKGYPWPREEFTGCFSIFDFCPRFLDWGGFQVNVYDKQEHQLYVIFHEMLHFIFYDYAQKNFPNTLGKMDTEEGAFWDIAEVFNVVIQSLDDFTLLQGRIDSMGYPNHKDLIIKGKNLWAKNNDVRQWISGMITAVLPASRPG